ncbi:MAG: class I SAM-dependent methyltransferase [Gammaproteobacteria bacterium]|nr:class I SAM-dependent methyltransferase [Gammaproteobacteria bacterium]
MLDETASEQEILDWLESEYTAPFSGWDFGYLDSRWLELGEHPWDYSAEVRSRLGSASQVLDVDTGGGEVLAELIAQTGTSAHITASEGYPPNVIVARKLLEALGVKVLDTSLAPSVFEDASFDFIINRHGGSLTPEDIARILAPGGCFITQQVGSRTDHELRALFGDAERPACEWPSNARDAGERFREAGLRLHTAKDSEYVVRFNDAGALVYYLKAVSWEVPGFSLQKFSDKLLTLHQHSLDHGFAIDTTFHSYLLIAHK